MSPCAAGSYNSAQALGKCGPSQYVGQTMRSYDDRSQDETTQGKIRRIEGQALTEKQWNSHGDHVRNVLTYLLHGEESFLRSRLVLQLIKKFPAFYGTRKFITVLTSARQLSRTAEKGWSYSLGVGRGANSSSPWKTKCYEIHKYNMCSKFNILYCHRICFYSYQWAASGWTHLGCQNMNLQIKCFEFSIFVSVKFLNYSFKAPGLLFYGIPRAVGSILLSSVQGFETAVLCTFQKSAILSVWLKKCCFRARSGWRITWEATTDDWVGKAVRIWEQKDNDFCRQGLIKTVPPVLSMSLCSAKLAVLYVRLNM